TTSWRARPSWPSRLPPVRDWTKSAADRGLLVTRKRRPPGRRFFWLAPDFDLQFELVQAVEQAEQKSALGRVHPLEQALLELDRQRCDLVIDAVPVLAQPQHRTAAVVAMHLALQSAGFDQPGHCTAHGHLVHR